MEDLDKLQKELERLLSFTVIRKMTLKGELNVLLNVDNYKGKGGKSDMFWNLWKEGKKCKFKL